MDRTTKALLFAIALGLWMNVASNWSVAKAQDVSDMVRHLRNIQTAVDNLEGIKTSVDAMRQDVLRIYRGTCTNQKICGV